MSGVADTAQLLLDLVATEHSRQRDALLQEALLRSTELERQAHRQARAQVRAAFQEARQSAEERLRTLEAKLATARRMQQQHADSALVDKVWGLLPAVLETRWQHPEARRRWIEWVLALALDALPASGWSVSHPPDLPASDLGAMRMRLAPVLPEVPAFDANATVRVGLRVRAGHNVLDGTLEGLLADRAAMGARVLALAGRMHGE